MKMINMVSPDGKTEIQAHPERKDYLISNGWTVKESQKTKAKISSKGGE